MKPTDRLALDGGTPHRQQPLPPWPHFDEEQIDAVAHVLRSGKVNYWTGPDVARFEAAFGEFTGTRYAIALANGTVALEMALRGLSIGPGDDVVVTSRSFVASASSVVSVGARPVFADIDPVSQNITAETVAAAMTERTRALIAVHLNGWPCEMDALGNLASAKGLAIIEDCAQAHGAEYRGRPVGGLGDVAAWSFCQDKIMSTGGEGGMITTNNPQIYRRVWELKDHGKNPDRIGQPRLTHSFAYVHDSIGTNARLTGPQAALGLVQLDRLPEWQAKRARHATRLADFFRRFDSIRIQWPPPHVRHAWYKFYALLVLDQLRPGWTRDCLIDAIRAEGIPCYSGACPEIYRESAFEGLDVRPATALPNARDLGKRTLMFPVHPTLSDCDVDDMASGVGKVLAQAEMQRVRTF